MDKEYPTLLNISNKIIGRGHRCFIIAEIGQNHQGDLEMAKKMIHEAKECGVDCVKFQRSNLSAKFTKCALERPYVSPNSFGTTYGEHKKFLEFSTNDFRELQKFSAELGLIFSASAMDEISLEELLGMGAPFVKIGSGDANNFPLLQKARDSMAPLIISTGMQNEEVIGKIYATMEGRPFGLLHCVSSYPTKHCDLNLQHIKEFLQKFPKAVIGYSGHEAGENFFSVAAVAMGATILERHFTLDKNLKGSDHKCSLEPQEMSKLVHDVRKIETYLDGRRISAAEEIIKILEQLEIIPKEDREIAAQLTIAIAGDKVRKLLKCEEECYQKLGKSLVYAKNAEYGDEITAQHLAIKVSHPKGLSPEDFYDIVGRTLAKSVKEDAPVKEADFHH